MRIPGTGLKLLMAVSADGYLARGPDDDMRWTGAIDKKVFRALTLHGGLLLVGRRTAEQLPPLPGRRLVTLSRDPRFGHDLEDAVHHFPGSWLIGGPEVALKAAELGLLESATLCVSATRLGSGIPAAPLVALLPDRPAHVIQFDGLSVEVFARGP